MEKTINIYGRKIDFKTNGAFPRFYRLLNKRDIFADMQKLNGDDVLADGGIEVLEDVAFAMAKFANPKDKITIEDWLAQFETFDLFEIMPELIAMWTDETETSSEAKKKTEQV